MKKTNSLMKVFSIEDIVLTNDEMIVIKAGIDPGSSTGFCGNGCGMNCGNGCNGTCPRPGTIDTELILVCVR
jgi:hypothetical protein